MSSVSDRLLRVLVAAAVAVVGYKLIGVLAGLLEKQSDVLVDLARSLVPEPVEPQVVRVDGSGRPLPGWMDWPERDVIVDPTDAGLPDVLVAERGPEPPWASWSEPLIDEPEVG